MKKLILMSALFFLAANPSFAENFSVDRVYGMFEASYQHQNNIINPYKTDSMYRVYKSNRTEELIIRKIKNLPDKEPYGILIGNNPTQKPISVQFKKLSKYGEQYKDLDAISKQSRGRLNIFINEKHKDAPIEALAALVVGRIYNFDEEDSLNEEIYCWTAEAYAWEYFLRKNDKLKDAEDELSKRENIINNMFIKGNYTEKFIKTFILEKQAYSSYAAISNGFTSKETDTKLNRLKKIYNYDAEDSNQ